MAPVGVGAMRQRSMIHFLVVWLAVWPAWCGRTFAQPVDPERIAAVKAGMVVNFIRYTTWPEGAFADEAAPIVLSVVGETEIDEALGRAVEGVLINGRRIEIRHVEYPPPAEGASAPAAADVEAFYDKLRESQAVFFGAGETDRIEELLEAVKDSNVLTASDIDDFAEKGGMLGLTIRDRRVAFDANEGEIKEADLQVSSQVLKLARVVKTSSKPTAEEAP